MSQQRRNKHTQTHTCGSGFYISSTPDVLSGLPWSPGLYAQNMASYCCSCSLTATECSSRKRTRNDLGFIIEKDVYLTILTNRGLKKCTSSNVPTHDSTASTVRFPFWVANFTSLFSTRECSLGWLSLGIF